MKKDFACKNLTQILQLIHGVEIELVGDNTFILEFFSMVDRKRVFSEGPWNLFKRLIIFKKVDNALKVSDMSFALVVMWV